MGPQASVPFFGHVARGYFKFYRAITGRNSFLPIISGEIVAVENGAQLRMTLRLHLAVVAFEFVFIGSLVGGLVENGFNWVLIGMIAFLLAITIGFFLQEQRRALAILRREFDNR